MFNFKVHALARALIAGSAMVVSYIGLFPNITHALWQAIASAREDTSILDRIADYARVSRTFRDNPVFGLGLGGAPPDQYGLLDNEWLRAIVQGGVVGVTAMIVLAAGGIFGVAAALRRATTPVERDQAYMLGSMFIAILVSSYTFDIFFYQQVTLIFFIVFGLLWSNFTVELPESQKDAKSTTADQALE
jgi:O-antigen ligase